MSRALALRAPPMILRPKPWLVLFGGVALGSLAFTPDARAQDAGPRNLASTPATVAASGASADATPRVGRGTAPGEPPGVPTPGPQVRSGRPESVPAPPLEWKWDRFSTADYAIGLTAGAITLATAIIQPLSTHHIQGGILFDNDVRDALRPSDIQVRYWFRDASDVGLSLMATWPFFVDALATAWWYHGSRDAAEQMALLDLETLAISGAVQGVTNVLVSRQRPYGPECGTSVLPSNSLDCTVTPEYRSFFSGHAAFSFTSAALICDNHAKLELLGAPWDAISCAGGYVVAAATSSFRVLADEHYASDVIVGALVGTLVGYGVPWLHERHVSPSLHTGSLTLTLVPSVGGAGLLGRF